MSVRVYKKINTLRHAGRTLSVSFMTNTKCLKTRLADSSHSVNTCWKHWGAGSGREEGGDEEERNGAVNSRERQVQVLMSKLVN